jgi:hypothetical protein
MALIQARLLPKLASDLDWIGASCLPPGLLVARTMNRAVVSTTERHRELVAGFSAERARLYEAQVVGVRGLAAADEAGLLGDVSKVLPVAVATRGGEREDAFVDALRLTRVGAVGGDGLLRSSHLSCRRTVIQGHSGFGY